MRWASLTRPLADELRSNAMPDTDKVFSGSIPENYERHLVPLIFENSPKMLLNE
jgi:hypothetical protein